MWTDSAVPRVADLFYNWKLSFIISATSGSSLVIDADYAQCWYNSVAGLSGSDNDLEHYNLCNI